MESATCTALVPGACRTVRPSQYQTVRTKQLASYIHDLVCCRQQKQESIRKDFASGRLNVLISTDVGAEGLDFRRCCLVAVLDPPTHVTPFVQCAGRARAPGSRYLLCVRDDKEEDMVAKRRRWVGGRVAAH